MQLNNQKLYLRRGREERQPVPMDAFVQAWMEVLGMNEWEAREGFAEDVAHGEIYEYRADDRETGQDVRQPIGCICPPTSERTCLNPMCPRAPVRDDSEFYVCNFDVSSYVTSMPDYWTDNTPPGVSGSAHHG